MPDSDTIKIKFWLSIGLVGCRRRGEIEIDRETWDDMDDREREQFVFESVNEYIDWNYEVEE